VPATNPELQEARRAGLEIAHRSDVLAALIAGQSSVAVAGSHGKTTTSTLIASLLHATNHDPTAVIGGVVPAFGSNGRNGKGALLVAEADESDGTLVKFQAWLGVITNLELDHTDHYADLAALIATLQRFGRGCAQLLANRSSASSSTPATGGPPAVQTALISRPSPWSSAVTAPWPTSTSRAPA